MGFLTIEKEHIVIRFSFHWKMNRMEFQLCSQKVKSSSLLWSHIVVTRTRLQQVQYSFETFRLWVCLPAMKMNCYLSCKYRVKIFSHVPNEARQLQLSRFFHMLHCCLRFIPLYNSTNKNFKKMFSLFCCLQKMNAPRTVSFCGKQLLLQDPSPMST